MSLTFRRIETGEYRGTCEGAPSFRSRSGNDCDGVDARDFLRGRRAIWVTEPGDHRLCGTCKRKYVELQKGTR